MHKLNELLGLILGYDFLGNYKVEHDARIKIKLQALHHLQSGKTLKEVSEIVLYEEKAVKEWLIRFSVFDYEGLIELEGRGRKPRLPVEEEENFKFELERLNEESEGGHITVFDIQNLLADKFDCNYSMSGTYTLLDRLNIVWISGRSKHPKFSQEAIDQFKEFFPEEVQKIKEKINSDKIEVWWQDECRVGQQGSLSRTWATKGTRPRVVRQKQFLSTYIFGAVCPDRDIGCALILPQTNAGMMQMHLNQISEHIRKGHHGIVLMDRASWHSSEALIVPNNITMMPLPPYSPELNPVEQVWQQLKKINLSNRRFENYDKILEACCDAWNCFSDEEGAIKNLCSRNWAKI